MLPTPARFHSLDALRGVAALAVVLWHWQHFAPAGAPPDRRDQPLYGVLYLVYTNGYLAVDLFFQVSGFVFYWLYADAVAARAVSARAFAVLRSSRLYPLHLATLAAVAAGQAAHRRVAGADFVYAGTDGGHLARHLLMLQGAGDESDLSFNGPAWSVSVEAALYGLFFALCRWLPVRPAVVLAASAAGFAAQYRGLGNLGRGAGSFFLGGVVFFAYHAVARSRRGRPAAGWAAAAAAGLWLLTLAAVHQGWPYRLLDAVPGGWRLRPYTALVPRLTLFPATVLALTLLEARRGSLGRPLAWVGDVSYSTYLLHFPLQLAVATTLAAAGVTYPVVSSPAVLAGFFAVLVGAAVVSHGRFERPAQARLRRLLLPRRPAAGGGAARSAVPVVHQPEEVRRAEP